MNFEIELQQSVEDNIKQLMQERVDHIRQVLKEEADPHAAIHQTRKDFKKLRALCRLVRDEIGKKKYRAANYYFRDTSRLLSEARDATALLETVQQLEQEDSSGEQTIQAVLQKTKHHLGGKKAAITRYNIQQEQLLPAVYRILEEAESYYQDWSIKHSNFKAVKPGLKRVYQRCRAGLKQAYTKKTGPAFHEWRKRAKYLRYQLNVLTPLWPGMLSAWEEELHTLTDYLGKEHDLAVLKQTVEQMTWEDGYDARPLLSLIKEKRKSLRKEAYPLGRKLFRQNAASFTNMIGEFWQVDQRKIAVANASA